MKRYSSGMRIRLAFAVAAHLDPEILIVDEVLSVGDVAFQAKCLEKMKSVAANEGRTVLYVSHQLATVEHLCPRALLISGGRLVFDGPTDETMAEYLRKFPKGEAGEMPGVFDLASADRSNGTYEPLLQLLEIRPAGGAPADNIRMGELLRIEIRVAGLNHIREPWSSSLSGRAEYPSCCGSTRLQCHLRPRKAEDWELSSSTCPAAPHARRLSGGGANQGGGQDGRLRRVGWHGQGGPSDVFDGGYRFDSSGGFDDGCFVVPWEWELRPEMD